MTTSIDTPTRLDIGSDGTMDGATRTYQKYLQDMSGTYFDPQAFRQAESEQGKDALVYEVQEQSYSSNTGALIVGTSRVLPGKYGNEFAMTRGHLHQQADRAELYHCLSGHGVMLLESVDGRSEAVELRAGQAVNVPGHWIHRSVNVGHEPFVTLFTYAADAGQDYSIISRAGGMKNLIVEGADGGWISTPNTRHSGYSVSE